MRILVLGAGAREHALSWKLGQESGVSHLVCAPGNPGIARSVAVAAVDPTAVDEVAAFVGRQRIDLTVVGPEAPLAAGLADALAARGLAVFGPTRAAARLETSKAFAKDFMTRHGVPTARYRVCRSAGEAAASIESGEFGESLVVKADGLAAGKGVVVAPDRAAALDAVRMTMVDRSFGAAGAQVVLEERLTGPELSFFVVAAGGHYVPLPSAQDHKRVFDGDRGPNTGGMGAFAPSPLMTPDLQARIERDIVRPVLAGMAAEGAPFCGFLYCGLMITADGPKVIEFNVRFGDPEAQAVLPLQTGPLAPLLWAAARGETLTPSVAPQPSLKSVAVVLAAHGYPGEVRSGDRIDGLDQIAREWPDVLPFFAGVKERSGALVTAGGRVMTLVGRGATFQGAIDRAYGAAAGVRFDGMQYRRDIGKKALG